MTQPTSSDHTQYERAKGETTVMGWDYMMNGWTGGGWMWVAMALFIALVALGTVAVVRATTKNASTEVDKR